LTNPSNLYAEKIFAEHPLGLWTLDEKCDYLSMILDESWRDMSSSWASTPVSTRTTSTMATAPFADSIVNTIVVSSSGPLVLKSSSVLTSKTDNFAIGTYINIAPATTASSVRLGYSLLSSPSTIIYGPSIPVGKTGSWKFFSSTFTGITPGVNNIQTVIEITYSGSSATFYINGFTVGNNSEEFNAVSLGTTLVRDNNYFYGLRDCVKFKNYGSDKNSAFLDPNLGPITELQTRNSSIPMVYGAQNTTILKNYLYVPSFGFFEKSGAGSTLTLEFWLRLDDGKNSSTLSGDLNRIVGPDYADNGLFVDGNNLILKIGENSCSYYVGEKFRPMLIDIVLENKSASLMINGEVVASTIFDKQAILDQVGTSTTGYLSFQPIPVGKMELDCIAIYPYAVSSDIAKRRFVYGQGVSFPENILTAFSGEAISLDFPFAKYSKTYDYPDSASWSQSVSDNIAISQQKISSPVYSLPTYVCSDKTISITDWSKKLILTPTTSSPINMKPTLSFENLNSYLFYPSLNILNNKINGIVGTFTIANGDTSTNKQILFKLFNQSTKDYFEITRSESTIYYTYKKNQEEPVLMYSFSVTSSNAFRVGIDIPGIIFKYPQLQEFFSNQNSLSLYLLGDYDGQDTALSTTFNGSVTDFGFVTEKNMAEIESKFTDGILAESTVTDSLSISYILMKPVSPDPRLNVSTKSYWQTQVPLSTLSTQVTQSDETNIETLDFIQINIDLGIKKLKDTNLIDTSIDPVKVFVTFQYIADGANKPLTDFTELSYDKIVLQPSTGWESKKYRVVDGTIIYPPEPSDGRSFKDISMCIHVEVIAENSLTKQISLRYIKLSSKNLSDNSSLKNVPINSIGTKIGKSLYPYKELTSGNFENISYKEKNPFKIFRGGAPHLFLSNDSGISLVGDYADRGLFMNINKNSSADSNISSMQMFLIWNNGLFPTSPTKIFDLKTDAGTIIFYIKSISSTNKDRGYIYATGPTGTDIAFYLNGNYVINPFINVNEWNSLAVSFSPQLQLNATGYLRILSPILVNNISVYQLDPTTLGQQVSYKIWDEIDGTNSTLWSSYSSVTWSDMFKSSSIATPTVTPSDIYKYFIGTNKIIVDSSSTFGIARFNDYQYAFYNNVQSSSYTASYL
jgi:hypothetical protein